MAYNPLLAETLFLDFYGTGSDPFATTADRIGPGGDVSCPGDASRQSIIVLGPDQLPNNDHTAVKDPSDNVVEHFVSLQETFIELNANVPSTVARALRVLLDLVKNPPRCVFHSASQYRAQ